MYRFGDFTSRANTAINLAIKISGELGHTYVGSEHLLWGLCGEGSGVAYCALQAESVRGVPQDRVGRAANTFYLGPDLCMGLGPVVGGFVLQAAGAAALFLFNAAAVLLGLILLAVFGSRRRGSSDRP